MGIFSRITEIINSNINSMLDKAEDPEKMVKLMIHEMEDTLTEVKSAAAEVVADKIRLSRTLDQARKRHNDWAGKAELAVEKGREDLAREALERKIELEKKVAHHESRLAEVEGLVKQYQDDIARLEEKLAGARARQRALIANHQSAMNRRKVEEKIYKLNTTGAFAKFESYENRIDRWHAEAEVIRHSNTSLEKKFDDLVQDQTVEKELASLKNRLKGTGSKDAKKENPAEPAAVSSK